MFGLIIPWIPATTAHPKWRVQNSTHPEQRPTHHFIHLKWNQQQLFSHQPKWTSLFQFTFSNLNYIRNHSTHQSINQSFNLTFRLINLKKRRDLMAEQWRKCEIRKLSNNFQFSHHNSHDMKFIGYVNVSLNEFSIHGQH